MTITTATATEMQNNFGKYLGLVMSGQEILVTRNGKEVGRFVPHAKTVSYLTDSLTGIIKGEYSIEAAKVERLEKKYGFANLVYVMRKELDAEKIDDVLKKLSLIFEFADFTASDFSNAAGLKWNDFEDALQSVTAERIHADYIVTRNVKDFTKSRIMAFTPEELLARL